MDTHMYLAVQGSLWQHSGGQAADLRNTGSIPVALPFPPVSRLPHTHTWNLKPSTMKGVPGTRLMLSTWLAIAPC